MLASRAEDALRAAGASPRILQSESQLQVSAESEEGPGRTSFCLFNCHRGLAKYKDGDSTSLSRRDQELVSTKGLLGLKKWDF